MAVFSIKSFNAQVDKFLLALPNDVIKINTIIGQDSIALIKNRLEDGKTAEGKSLGKYSDNPISALSFLGKGLGSGSDSAVKSYAKANGGKLSYEKFRQLNNRPTDHVNLFFTGETLNDIAVTSSKIEGNKVITKVSSKNSKTKEITNSKGKVTGSKTTGDVLSDLDGKYGRALNTELLSLSVEEEKLVSNTFDKQLQTLLDKYFS